MEIVLDTNAYSDWLKLGRWEDVITKAECVWIPCIVIGELFHGFVSGSRFKENEARLRKILDHPYVGVMSCGVETAKIFGELVSFLRKQGTPIPTNDIWIAACCHEHGLPLVTSDTHFRQLPQIRLVR